MKKILTVFLTLTVLTGCSSSNNTLSENPVLYTINGKDTYKQDFYNSMRLGDDGSVVINAARTQILANLDVDQDEVQKIVDENISQLEEVFGDQVGNYVQSFGFASLDDFIDKQVRPSIMIEIKAKEELDKKGLDLIDEYSIKKIEYLSTTNKETLETYQTMLKDGTAMNSIELDTNTKYYRETFSKSVEVPSKTLGSYLSKKQETGLGDIIYDEESNLYFLINNIEITDANELIAPIFKNEDYIKTFSGKLFIDEGFEVYDKDTRKKMKTSYPDYIK